MASESGESGETSPELSQSSIVGQNSNLVIDESRNDKVGILSHEETHVAGQVGQGLTGEVVTPENAPNKANPEPEQCAEPQTQGSGEAVAKAREQSQSSGVAAIDDGPGAHEIRRRRQSGSRDPQSTIQS